MGLIGLTLLALVQAGVTDSSHILVIRGGGDTTQFALGDTISLAMGEEVELEAVLYDETGHRVNVESLWWHNTSDGFIEFPELDPTAASGTGRERVVAEFPGTDDIMLHGPGRVVHWIWFRVLARRGPALD